MRGPSRRSTECEQYKSPRPLTSCSLNSTCSRWLRMLFTREFPMPDSMKLWDGLFACDPTLDLALWVCVAMLIRVRNQRKPSTRLSLGYTHLTKLQKPSNTCRLQRPVDYAPEVSSAPRTFISCDGAPRVSPSPASFVSADGTEPSVECDCGDGESDCV